MMQFLHARDPSSLLSGFLSTRLYLYCTTHCQPAHEFTTGKEWQDKQQWDEQGHDLNGPLWSSSRGKDCAWDNIKIPTTFSTVDLFLPSKGITAQPEYQHLYIVSTKTAQPSQHQQVRNESFPKPVHSALVCSYAGCWARPALPLAGPWCHLTSSWDPSCEGVLTLPEQPWHRGNSPPMPWCHSASCQLITLGISVGGGH